MGAAKGKPSGNCYTNEPSRAVHRISARARSMDCSFIGKSNVTSPFEAAGIVFISDNGGRGRGTLWEATKAEKSKVIKS
jgi:hypothetical protein